MALCFSKGSRAAPFVPSDERCFPAERTCVNLRRFVLHSPKEHRFDRLTPGQFITPSGRVAIYALPRSVQLRWIFL